MTDPSPPPDDVRRAALVDDEPPARTRLADALARHPEITVVATAASGAEALDAVEIHRPDVLFLDVQMPGLDGFETLELIDERIADRDLPSLARPTIVFVTAYDAHALRAFEVHAFDYLLKPFTAARLAETIRRLSAPQGAASDPAAPSARALAQQAGRPAARDRLALRGPDGVRVVPMASVDYVEAHGDAVVYVVEGARWRKPQTLTEAIDTLDPQRFVRIHRSTLLNLARLARVERYAKDSRVAILHDGTRLPISRSGWPRLRNRLR
ncbi:MAG: LytTR family DNA-binding domain-containing protein [Acidobacteriota bacterium]